DGGAGRLLDSPVPRPCMPGMEQAAAAPASTIGVIVDMSIPAASRGFRWRAVRRVAPRPRCISERSRLDARSASLRPVREIQAPLLRIQPPPDRPAPRLGAVVAL